MFLPVSRGYIVELVSPLYLKNNGVSFLKGKLIAIKS